MHTAAATSSTTRLLTWNSGVLLAVVVLQHIAPVLVVLVVLSPRVTPP